MQKRIFSLCMTVMILLGAMSLCVSAETEQLSISSEAMGILKAEEGFSRTPSLIRVA